MNLLGWPRDVLPVELPRRCCAAASTSAHEAGCHVAGGHSIDDPEPKYGMAVTGLADPDRLLRNDAAVAGMPLTLTKPLGVGVLNSRHKAPVRSFAEAVASMAALNARRRAGRPGRRRRGGHRRHRVRPARAPVQDGAGQRGDRGGRRGRRALPRRRAARRCADGFVCGGTRRNLDWVRPHLDAGVAEDELLLLADAQTSGGLLVAGEMPGAPVIGEFVPRGETRSSVR